MSRLRRFSVSSILSVSSLFSHGEDREESDSDDNPAPDSSNPASNTAPKSVRLSTRIQAHLKGLLPAKTLEAPGKKTTTQEDPPTEHAIYLSTLNTLPPVSPVGCQYAVETQQGEMTFAHYAGEEYSQWLQDGFPDYEKLVGEEEADKARRKIEVFGRKNYQEVHDILMPGNLWYASENWEPGEESNVSRYPYAICTDGVAMRKQPRPAAGSSEKDSPTKDRKREDFLSDVLWDLEKATYSSDSEDESYFNLKTSDTLDKEVQSPELDSDEMDALLLAENSQVEFITAIPSPFKRFILLDTYKG
ncbi:hypothetical protein DHEL01_v209503 [Diaporthe helianthi]|uniref:Uncharacterized protein n=1 Tax=Diaporthe helianthi TaxID=158607 RepID=A0A2P5HPE2_DIAHE|nr:hypothetical protein DHEL01_v209503 [Diaporthe helianthi]